MIRSGELIKVSVKHFANTGHNEQNVAFILYQNLNISLPLILICMYVVTILVVR